jgi:HK97 family phage prohead protease
MTIIITDPIDLPFINKMQARIARALGLDRPPPRAHEPDEESSLCVEGLAVITDEPIATKNGDIIVFESSAFNEYLANAARPEFWLEHNSSKVVAKSGVEIAKIEGGIVFRAPITGSRYESKVQRMVDSKDQAAISIGVTHNKYRKEKVGDHDVIFVERATIDEVSLVKAGAVETAFARLVDSRYASLKESAKSKPFAIERGIHDIRVQHGKVVDRLAVLARKLSALEPKKPSVKKTESKVDAWFKRWNASEDAKAPAIQRWAEQRDAKT